MDIIVEMAQSHHVTSKDSASFFVSLVKLRLH